MAQAFRSQLPTPTRSPLRRARAALGAKEISATRTGPGAYWCDRESAGVLNAFITEAPRTCALQCRELGCAPSRPGEARARLEGIPLAIKDLFCTNGVRTNGGQPRILDNFVPTYEIDGDAESVECRRGHAGQGPISTNSAMGFVETRPLISARVTSPWRARGRNEDLVPGGLVGRLGGGGVSGHLAIAAIGTDTGGSIRPAGRGGPALWG